MSKKKPPQPRETETSKRARDTIVPYLDSFNHLKPPRASRRSHSTASSSHAGGSSEVPTFGTIGTTGSEEVGTSNEQSTSQNSVVIMANVSGFKIPAAWDQNRPKFDGENANSLRNFIRNCESIFTQGNITGEQEKKEKLLEYVDHNDIREQWERLPTFAAPATFVAWKAEILQLYPEIEDMAQGSLQKLMGICAASRPISRSELGKLRRFSAAFENEAGKLTVGSALVVNMSLVEMILGVLDPSFATELENAMNQVAVIATAYPLAVPAGQQGALQLTDRRGDRLPYKQVLKIADLLADNWVGRGSKALVSGGSRLEPAIGIAGSSIPIVSNETVKIKQEITERLEAFAGELARVKDSAVLQEKRIGDSIKRMESTFETSIRQLSQSLRPRPPHMDQPGNADLHRPEQHHDHNHGANNGSNQGNRGNGPGPCYFCLGPHYVNDCPIKDDFIGRGWVTVENGIVKLGNGNWIPRFPEHLSRAQRVEEYYNKQGSSKGPSNVKQANMVQNFYSGGYEGPSGYSDPYNEDRVGHLYDTIDDELRSAKVQQMVRLRAANQAYQPSSSQNYQAPVIPGPSYPTVGTNMAQIVPQFQQSYFPVEPPVNVQTNVPTVPQQNNVDFNQLIQFMNLMNAANRTGTPVQEQMVTTRGGSKTDPPPQSKN